MSVYFWCPIHTSNLAGVWRDEGRMWAFPKYGLSLYTLKYSPHYKDFPEKNCKFGIGSKPQHVRSGMQVSGIVDLRVSSTLNPAHQTINPKP